MSVLYEKRCTVSDLSDGVKIFVKNELHVYNKYNSFQ
jgi:hypothetical protein